MLGSAPKLTQWEWRNGGASLQIDSKSRQTRIRYLSNATRFSNGMGPQHAFPKKKILTSAHLLAIGCWLQRRLSLFKDTSPDMLDIKSVSCVIDINDAVIINTNQQKKKMYEPYLLSGIELFNNKIRGTSELGRHNLQYTLLYSQTYKEQIPWAQSLRLKKTIKQSREKWIGTVQRARQSLTLRNSWPFQRTPFADGRNLPTNGTFTYQTNVY